ncbi:LptF/LptG family permease [Rickettsia endosymbiont of Halotydeus destructor]|uniref:LptF/LptG family permease n=1 Tax=Rickettsia endosymbiont of Halotydeus destructor TaxID=2996754 RepID=UPI003BAE2389
MINLKTLSWYLFRSYCGYFLTILFLLTGILVIANIFDLLQKFKNIYIPFHFFWRFTLYKIPYLLSQVASLISFIAMLFFLKNLTKNNELITILSSGVHIWRILVIPVFTVLILGIGFTAILDPIGALGLQKYEVLETKLLKKRVNEVTVSKSGLLVFESYQGNNHQKNNYQRNNQIIQTQSINLAARRLNNVTILLIGSDNSFLKRIDAKYAIAKEGSLDLNQVKVFTGTEHKNYDSLTIPTNLSIDHLAENFPAPEMVSIWKLPELIKQLLKSGVPVINYQIYYYKQLFKPIMMIATVILASCFISLRQRDNSQEKILIIGLFVGFIVYSLSEILLKILAYNSLSLITAILLPSMLIFFISNFIILHYKEI